MSTLRDLISRIVALVPGLQLWYEGLDEADYEGVWPELAWELTQLGEPGSSNAFLSIAPLLEEALREHDTRDHVSLGFFETYIVRAEQRRLDTPGVRARLGPAAVQVWDSLYDYLHQGDWVLVTASPANIAGFVGSGAAVLLWTTCRGQRVPAHATVAQINIDGVEYELKAELECRVDRFAVTDGQQFGAGDLIMYLLPMDYRELRRHMPYLRLAASGRHAAA